MNRPRLDYVGRRRYLLIGGAAVLFQAAVLLYWYGNRHATNPEVFATLGTGWARHFGVASLATDRVGYDGQFYYYMARFPGHINGGFDVPGQRYGRMLYPLLASVVSLGAGNLVPWGLLVINVLAVAATAVLLADLLNKRGLSPWFAVVAVVYCGQLLPTMRDLADPLAVFFMAAALWSRVENRWTLAAVACALGALTRETNVLLIVALVLPLLLEGRIRPAIRFATIALLPFVAWHALLLVWLHDTGLSEAIHAGYTPPTARLAVLIGLLAGVPLAAAIVLALGCLARRRGPAAIPLCVLGFALLFILQPADHWSDAWGVFRVAAPVVVLLPLLPARRLVMAGLVAVAPLSLAILPLL